MRILLISFILLLNYSAYAGEIIKVSRGDGQQTTLMLYGDWNSKNCADVILLSHGLGGTEKGLSYLASAFADKGYRTAVMGHTVFNERKELRKLIFGDRAAVIVDQKKFHHRFMDVDAALDFVNQKCAPEHIFLGGHSLGAATTIIESGAIPELEQRGQDRFDAYIALSFQGEGPLFKKGAWKNIDKPVLMITGTKDKTINGDYTKRLNAFDGLPNGQKRMVIIDGANHANLGGRKTSNYTQIVVAVVEEFLNQFKEKNFTASNLASEHVQITEK